GISSGKPNSFQTDSGIKLMLVPKSAMALHLSSLKPHGMRNFPSNGFGRSGNGRSISNKATASGDGLEFTLRVSNCIARERSRP
nr:hypothetical protein [Tanacetum cinerariifolium]